jgi:hypothetical protein
MTFVGFADKVLTGSGEKPFRLVWWLVVAWVLNTIVFSLAADRMAPTNAALLQGLRTECTPQGRTHPQWTRCARGAMKDYPKFYPPLYALDVLVPIMDLQQSRLWQPISRDGWPGFLTFLWRCFAGAFGWLLGVALGSVALRYVKGEGVGPNVGLTKSN